MVAMICPEKQGDNLSRLFHNQYINVEGKWTTDFDHKATCRQDKVEILEYCRKVLIFNIPEIRIPDFRIRWRASLPQVFQGKSGMATNEAMK